MGIIGLFRPLPSGSLFLVTDNLFPADCSKGFQTGSLHALKIKLEEIDILNVQLLEDEVHIVRGRQDQRIKPLLWL